MSEYRETPDEVTGYPKGIPYIIANEAAERFSFYGMKAALAVFMAHYLGVMGGENMNEAQATSGVAWFTSAVYLTPLLGAFLADRFLGKYRVIVWLSIVYCLGHLCLAFMGVGGVVQFWLLSGLGLIALGAGGIKPCVSAHVGDQFGKSNQHLLTKVFNIFYFSINAGAVLSNLFIPVILKWHGPHWAFGVPGVLMALATVFFWMGRREFIHVPAKGKAFVDELFGEEGLKAVGKLIPLYLFVAVFWCLFDQTASSLVFQAEKMDRNLFGYEVLPSQIQAANPFLILLLIPLFTFVIYPMVGRVVRLTPLRKVGAGLFLMVLSFAVIAWAQEAIDRGEEPSVGWQLLAYVIFTTAEVLISIVCLEFSYTQSPRRMKSVMLALFLASVFLGNVITALINLYIQIPGGGEVSELPDEHVKAALSVQSHYEREGVFPQFSLGDLDYRILHAGAVRLSSAGADGEFKTKDDVNTVIEMNESDTLEKGTWLYREKIRLGQLDESKTSESSLSIRHSQGGGVKLEGADYFWFFTWLMLGTAILFVPYAVLYQEKTYLQE